MRTVRTRSTGRRTASALVGGAIALGLLGACSSDVTTERVGDSTSSPPATGTSSTTSTTNAGDTTATSTTSTTSATSTTTTAGAPSTSTGEVTPTPTGAVLRGDGLSVAAFGDPEAAAMASLTTAFGPPTYDSGWRPGNETMVGIDNRMVAWAGLWVTFFDTGAGPAFQRWRYTASHADFPGTTPDLATVDGLRLGTPAGDIAALDGSVPVSGEGATGFRVETATGTMYLWFTPHALDGPPEPDSTLSTIDAGNPRGDHGP